MIVDLWDYTRECGHWNAYMIEDCVMYIFFSSRLKGVVADIVGVRGRQGSADAGELISFPK